jgi:micrococcal nuclease
VSEYCPRCGTERLGAFRFCRACRFDFDSPAELAPTHSPTEARLPPGVDPASQAGGRRWTRNRVLAIGVASVFGLGAIASVTRPNSTPATALAGPTATPPATPTSAPTIRVTPSPTAEPTFGPTGPTVEAHVVRVIDGDTIVVAYGGQEYHVRYIGMDTPETKDPNEAVQWMGPQATAANAALVEGQTVFLEKDVSETDSFDRLLRYVWLMDGAAWTLVNLELVRQGVAFAKSYPPDVRYDSLYSAAQGEARTASLGLWAPTPAPPTPAPTPVPTPVPLVEAPPEPASNCHPSYDPCLPIVDDLDCADVRALGVAPVDVIGTDSYRLDRDKDGLGCE